MESSSPSSSTGPILIPYTVHKKILCREKQLNHLRTILGETPYDETPKALFIYGDTATGKSIVLRKCLKKGNYMHVYVHCAEAINLRVFLEDIINQMIYYQPFAQNNFQPYTKCHNLDEFIAELEKVEDKYSSLAIYVVFDHSELLINTAKEVFSVFLRLGELTNATICPIFVSNLPWSLYSSMTYNDQPPTLHFPRYTREELILILQKQRPHNVTPQFFNNFVQLFGSVFFNATTDIRELGHKLNICFQHYYAPIQAGELTESDATKLWRKSQQFFKNILKQLYLNISETIIEKHIKVQLSFYSKYLIIAAYIASFNPVTVDRQLFVKHSEKIKKSKRSSRKLKRCLTGPKCFGLDRLIAITSAILNDESLVLTNAMYTQIATLEEMKFLTRISVDRIENPTFKCNFGFQFVEAIAKNVDFPIKKYLVDFMDC